MHSPVIAPVGLGEENRSLYKSSPCVLCYHEQILLRKKNGARGAHGTMNLSVEQAWRLYGLRKNGRASRCLAWESQASGGLLVWAPGRPLLPLWGHPSSAGGGSSLTRLQQGGDDLATLCTPQRPVNRGVRPRGPSACAPSLSRYLGQCRPVSAGRAAPPCARAGVALALAAWGTCPR